MARLEAESGAMSMAAAVTTGDSKVAAAAEPIRVQQASVPKDSPWPLEITLPQAGQGVHTQAYVVHPVGRSAAGRGLQPARVVGCCDASEAVHAYWKYHGITRAAPYNVRAEPA
jgi:hypothetical protein